MHPCVKVSVQQVAWKRSRMEWIWPTEWRHFSRGLVREAKQQHELGLRWSQSWPHLFFTSACACVCTCVYVCMCVRARVMSDIESRQSSGQTGFSGRPLTRATTLLPRQHNTLTCRSVAPPLPPLPLPAPSTPHLATGSDGVRRSAAGWHLRMLFLML